MKTENAHDYEKVRESQHFIQSHKIKDLTRLNDSC